ncbi:DNA recombination protein RmuC [Chloroflexota bacterium]
MEIAITILLAILVVLVILLVWDRLRGGRRWKEQGDALSKVVGEKLEGNLAVFGDVRERLGELTKRTRDIEEVGKSISSLQEALRAPKFRGEFGELGLEMLLANILPPSCYFFQHRFRNGEVIVDAVVQIGDKLVPIDSKFPFALADFERMVTTESEEEKNRLRRQFIRTFKRHIDDVSKYILPDENTFDFALMYIPAENVYYETIVRGHQPADEGDVYSYCLQKRVFPVSPNSFYAYLQAIVLGLKGLQVEKSAREILGRLEGVRVGLQDFQEDYELVGTHLSHAIKKHTDARSKLTKLSDRVEFLAGDSPAETLAEADAETGEEERLE